MQTNLRQQKAGQGSPRAGPARRCARTPAGDTGGPSVLTAAPARGSIRESSPRLLRSCLANNTAGSEGFLELCWCKWQNSCSGGWTIPHCKRACTHTMLPLSTHLSMDTQLATVTTAAMNMRTQVSLQDNNFTIWKWTQSGTAESHGSSSLNLLRKLHAVFHNDGTDLHSQQQEPRVLRSPRPRWHLLSCGLLITAIPRGEETTHWSWRAFPWRLMRLLGLRLSSLEKRLFTSFVHFGVVFLLVIVWVPCIFWKWTPYRIGSLQVYSPFPWALSFCFYKSKIIPSF